jgi:putative sugar O-methyltransferase
MLDRDSVSLFSEAAEHAGLDLSFPQVGGVSGIRVKSDILPINYFYHLYACHRFSTILGTKNWRALEIGGGVGGLAYASTLNGARSHCVVDLPLVNVLQGYLLLKSRVADRVALFGEKPKEDSIRILPNWQMESLLSEQFDIVINQDSMPEMGDQTASNYLMAIEQLKPRYFLSVNQEAGAPVEGNPQPSVHQLVSLLNGSARLLYRAPYWLRRGYTEEVYCYI